MNRRQALMLLLFLGNWLLAGCGLCTKHLYLYRDTPEKSPSTANRALLITDPDLANAVMAGSPRYPGGGCQWAPEQPSYESDSYRLSMDAFDGKPVYQGLCLDTTPTYSCEVRAGSRQVRLRFDLSGPWGKQSVKEVSRLDFEPGACYFLQPDGEALASKRFVLKVERMPEAYTAERRARLIDIRRKTTKGFVD